MITWAWAVIFSGLGAGEPTCSFAATARLPAATVAHAATELADGRVLVTGGYGELFRVPIAANLGRIYDPNTGKWRSARGQMQVGRLAHAAVRLADGRVVLIGGINQARRPLASIEIFDPKTEKFRRIGEMLGAREFPRATLLARGRILITGGGKEAEILEQSKQDSAGWKVRKAPQVKQARWGHVQLTLADGRVLLAGGMRPTLEWFDPEKEKFTFFKARLPEDLDDQAGVLLYDGRVLLAGGQTRRGRSVAGTWIFDPERDTITPGRELHPTAAGKEQPGVSDMVAVDLFAGDRTQWGRYLLLAGGEFDPGSDHDTILDSAWIYDAEAGRLISVGPMRRPHDDFAAAFLPAPAGSARVLLIGGHGTGDSFQSECEIFNFRF